MAEGLPPEAIPPDINYRGHPDKINKTVFCVLCDSVFYKSDFNRKKFAKYISPVMVICDEHPTVDITSLDNPRALLIQSRKLNDEYTKLKSQYENLLKEKSQERETMMEYELDDNHLLEQVRLLKDLNSELKDKNRLLQELLDKEKENPKAKKQTYAGVLTQQFPQMTKIMPKIRLTRKKKEDKSDMELHVKHYLTKDSSLKTKKIECKSKDEILVTCIDEESTRKAKNYFNSKLNHIYKVEEEQLKKPIIKIIGIESTFCEDQKTLENDINTRNFSSLQTKGNILNISVNPKNKKTSVIMEITSEIHKYIKENRNRLFVAFLNCRVYDVINIKPCFKCGVLGHNQKKCNNNMQCLKCAGQHMTKDCKESKKCCVNCCFANNKYNKKYNVNHIATDSDECEILKTKIRNYIMTTDYIIKPDLPRYVAKVENFKNDRDKYQQDQGLISAFEGSTESIATRTRSKYENNYETTNTARLRFGSSSSLGSTKM